MVVFKRPAILLFLLLCLAQSTQAADYRFTLPKELARVVINTDGSARIDYELTFSCDQGGKPIDIVDIGMPNTSYRLSTASASVDGVRVLAIKTSEYVKPGVELHLGAQTVQPGTSASIVFSIMVDKMVYRDSRDSSMASVEFSPTWYGSAYVHGTTRQEVDFVFPPGVRGEEVRYHREKFSASGLREGRVVYAFTKEADPSRQYLYGVSFPKKYVTKIWGPAVKITKEMLIAAVLLFLGLFIFLGLYFHGTGRKRESRIVFSILLWIVFIAVVAPILIASFLGAPPAGIFLLFIVFSIVGGIQQRRRKMKYLPPVLRIEGLGVRMGLTAPEAATLLEVPLDKVLMMVAFGLIRKGRLRILSQDPLRLEKTDPPPGTAAEIHPYETKFLSAIRTSGTLNPDDLKKVVLDLVSALKTKMASFSYSETVKYYRNIVTEAWKKVEAANTPEIRGEAYADNFEWTIFDENYERRTHEVFRDEPVLAPRWWSFSGSSSAPAPSGDGPSVSLPSLPTLPGAQFAAQSLSWTQSFAGGIVSGLESFTGGVTATTNPLPVSSSGGSGGCVGGGGCACACACAGCACACAGGGR
jgi:hypothetical protein